MRPGHPTAQSLVRGSFVLFSLSSWLHGVTIYVDDACPGPGTGDGSIGDPYCLIQDAIDAAVSGVDEVVVFPGDYFETIDFIGKAITLRSSEGPDVTMINGFFSDTVVRCINGEGPDTVLDGFIIAGGRAFQGGGMLNLNSSPTVLNCLFGGNEAIPSLARGGGMHNEGGTPTIMNCTFSGNLADSSGGAISNLNADPIISDCMFDGNFAEGTGGGMHNDRSSPIILDCVFSENLSTTGAGMKNFIESHPQVTGCVFDSNYGTGVGGGVYNDIDCDPSFFDCLFVENNSSNGGGFFNGDNSNPSFTNCAFVRNESSGGSGGAIHNLDSSPTVTNCTFTENVARDNGGGVINRGDSAGSSPTIINSIFWNNFDDSDGFSGGPFFDESAQIHTQWGTPTVDFSCVQGGWTGAGGAGNIAADPLFVDAPNDDLHLLAGSPCLNAGTNAAANLPLLDLDGALRIQECVVDMGAYEATPVAPSIPADRDCDGDVDGVDFAVFSSCFNKAGNPPRTENCIPEQQQQLHLDDDGDVDGVDFSTFASCFNKAGNPPRTFGCPAF